MLEQKTTILNRLRPHWPFLILLASYVIAAVWLSFRLPAFVTPNEPLHYEHAALLRRTGRLPDPNASQRMDERHQPPLYYALVALAGSSFSDIPLDTELEQNPFYFKTIAGNRNQFLHTTPSTVPLLYAGRLVSTLLGAVGVVAIYIAAVQSLPPPVGLLVAALMAFQPMFLFLSASLNNDLAVTALISVLLAYTTFLIVREQGPPTYLLWGVIFALAVLTKATALFLAVTLAVACLARWRRTGRLRLAFACGLAGLAGFIPFYAAWLFANVSRGLDAMGVADSLPVIDVIKDGPAAWASLRGYLFTLWKSFLLDWSAGETGYTESWVYTAWLILLIIAAAGWIRRRHVKSINAALFWMHLLWILPLLWMFLSVKSLMIQSFGFLVPEGRWVIPALPSLAWLLGAGWSRWWPERSRRRASFLASAVPVLFTLILLLAMMPKLYPQPQRLSGSQQIPASAQNSGLIYNNQIELLATEVENFANGQPLKITTYWQALTDVEKDYIVSTELIVPLVDRWEKIAGVKTHPGLGLAPTGGWRKGEVYRDEIVLAPTGARNGPTRAFLNVQLLDGEQALPAGQKEAAAASSAGRPLTIYPQKALAPPPAAQLETPVTFGGIFDLIAVSTAAGDDGLDLTLWWRARAETGQAVTIFVHLLDDQGQLVSQADAMPDAGRSPTNIWQPGDVIRDVHRLPAPSSPTASILIGAYLLETSERLPAVQGEQPLPDQAYHHKLNMDHPQDAPGQ
jgi:hypothetical protein